MSALDVLVVVDGPPPSSNIPQLLRSARVRREHGQGQKQEVCVQSRMTYLHKLPGVSWVHSIVSCTRRDKDRRIVRHRVNILRREKSRTGQVDYHGNGKVEQRSRRTVIRGIVLEKLPVIRVRVPVLRHPTSPCEKGVISLHVTRDRKAEVTVLGRATIERRITVNDRSLLRASILTGAAQRSG
jgi:hypothetical protein